LSLRFQITPREGDVLEYMYKVKSFKNYHIDHKLTFEVHETYLQFWNLFFKTGPFEQIMCT